MPAGAPAGKSWRISSATSKRNCGSPTSGVSSAARSKRSRPKAGEDAELETERRILQNFARIEEAARGAYETLYDSPASALAGIRSSIRRLEELARIDPALGALAENLKPTEFAVEEASYALRDYLSHLEANPERLEEIESRLAALDKLKRKYGAALDQVLAYLEDVRARMAAVENAEERRAALGKQLKELTEAYEDAAGRLSRAQKRSRPQARQTRGGGARFARHGAHLFAHGPGARRMVARGLR